MLTPLISIMASLKSLVLATLILTHMGCVVVSQDVQWTSDLSDLLTNTGLREDLLVGTLLGRIGITGIPTDIIHVSYSTNSSYFSVAEQTGEVRLNAELNYRYLPTFDVIFFARDASQGFSVQRIVTVNVRGVNHAPRFDIQNYQVSVKDNVPVGTTFYSLIYFTDVDTGPNGTVTLTCNPTDADADLSCRTFRVTQQPVVGKDDSYLGNISTILTLNYLNKTRYTMPLLVQDQGSPPLSATAVLTVNIESQFDNRPVFVNSPIILAVNESAPSTTDLGFVQAKTGGVSRTNPLGLSISDDAKHWFYLENTTYDAGSGIYSARIRTFGNISRAQLPSDQYAFKVAAAELSNGQPTPVSSETVIQVLVQGVNIFAPTFDLPTYTISITEGLGVGAVVPGLTMGVRDIDQGDNSFFALQLTSILPSPVTEIFLVRPPSAQGSASVYLVVNKPEYLVYNDPTRRRYVIVVTAIETKTTQLLSGSTTVIINVLNRNYNPPVFTRSVYLASLVDNRDIGTTVTTQIQANDLDNSNAGRITYSIISGNNNLYFAINQGSGVITLAKTLSYSVTGDYVVLTIMAQNGVGLNSTATLRIQIIDSNHQGPRFNPPFVDTIVQEGQVNLVPPILFNASPLEKDRVVSYRIVGGDTSLFSLRIIPATNPNQQPSGEVTMLRGVDYNETPNRSGVFQIIVEATSSAPNPLSTNLTINVYVTDTNNHPPIFNPTYYSTTITEITPPETPLLTVNATDLDAPNSNNSKIHYIISTGSRDNFVIDYTTGLIRVASRANLTIDQFGDQYNITVLAIDEGSPPLTATATVYIKVKDSIYRSPSFSLQVYTFRVDENATVNTFVGSTQATSPDRRAVLSYSIRPGSISAKDKNGQPVTSSNGSSNYNTSFAVTITNGTIVVNGPLSYEYFVRLDLQVQAVVTNPETNGTILPAVANVTIFVLPMIQSSDSVLFLDPANRIVYITIYNTLRIGTPLYQLSAYHLATRKQITRYNYTASDPKTIDYITVGYPTGLITLAQYLASINLNLPMNLTYTVTASAEPPSKASEMATVVINVRNENADNPVFNQERYNFTIYNNVTQGSFVGTIDAKVQGSSQSPILYTLTGSNAFNIDNRTGVITVNNPAAVNERLIFALTGQASAGNSRNTQVLVYVNVIHFFNTLPPRFSLPEYTFYTLDKTPVSTTIGLVNAIDPDVYHSSTIMYATTGNGTDYFQLDPITGVIQTKKPLISNQFPYTLMVTANSSGIPVQTSVVMVKIFVAHVNASGGIVLYVPEDESKTYYAYVNRPNYPIFTALGESTRPAANLTYSISTPGYNGPGIFIMNPLTGELTTNGTLKYDPNNPIQTVCVSLTDNVQPFLDVSRCIKIQLVSAQPPAFSLCAGLNSTILASVLENMDPGAYVATIKACSLDMPPNNTDMKYNISGGNLPVDCYGGKSPFQIDPESGNITTTVTLRWNCTKEIRLNVTVSYRNGTTAVNGSTQEVVITILPTDSSGPTFGGNLPGTCRGVGTEVTDGILDFTPPGTVFIQMYAGDCDAPQYGSHNYSIKSNQISFFMPDDQSSSKYVPNAFVIDPITGDVRTNLPNYRDYSRGYFQMTIIATDDKQRSATALLTVFIVREGQRIKFVFGKTPSEMRQDALNFLVGTNYFLSQYTNYKYGAYGGELNTHIDTNAFYYFNETDLCFQVIRNDKQPEVLPANEAIALFPPSTSNSFDWIMRSLYNNYTVISGPQQCYVKTTTHWWSGYWFLWWFLIALGLFIFVVALILNILACCFWPMYTRGYLKSRPYIVLDEPPTTSPVSDFEWQESMHRIN